MGHISKLFGSRFNVESKKEPPNFDEMSEEEKPHEVAAQGNEMAQQKLSEL